MSATEEEVEIPKPRDEITVRDHERRQLVEFLPEIIEMYEAYESDEMVERRESFEEFLVEFEQPIDGDEASYPLGGDNWNDLARALDELDETRASWLASKLGRRAELSSMYMGFTTAVPFMAMATGEDPVHPDRQ